MASAQPLSTTLAVGALVQLLSLVLDLDGHESGPLQGYNLFLEHTLLGFRYTVVHTDTWRYEDSEHSVTPPFSALGVTQPYMSHDRRARSDRIMHKKLRGYPKLNL